MLANEYSGGACVVEVDVREQEVANVLKLEPTLAQGRMQPVDAGRRAAVVERRAVLRLENGGADDALGALIVEVEGIRAHRARILPCVRPKWSGGDSVGAGPGRLLRARRPPRHRRRRRPSALRGFSSRVASAAGRP